MVGVSGKKVLALIVVIILGVSLFGVTLILQRKEVYSVPTVEVLGIRPEAAPLYSLVEVDVNVSADFDNPFDPGEIDVRAVLVSPSGRKIIVPAFYYQEFKRELAGGGERLSPVGKPVWKVRFTPTEVGRYEVYVEARDRRGYIASSGVYSFQAVPSRLPGFVRVSSRDPRYFEFDDGSSNFFVGINVCWSGSKGTYDYDEWFAAMSAAGINMVRIWMAPWCFGIEWNQLGRYNLREAWKLDYVLKLAEKYGIYVILCLMNHGQLSTQVNPQWSDNPYNKARGGPLNEPEEFWTNEEAIELFKRRLRYIVARWSYSTHLLAWELWNEVDLTDNYMAVREQVAKWHREMATYLKSIDPYNRLVTTSFANPNLDPLVWTLDEIDFVTIHKYGPEGFRDIPMTLRELVLKALELYGKPVLVTEFGVDWRWEGKPYYYFDKEGVGLHDGLWSTLVAGSPVTAMSWWWDNYVHPFRLYYHFKAVSEFFKGVSPTASNFQSLVAEPLLQNESREESQLGDVRVYPSLGWARPYNNYFVVKPDGSIEGDITQIPSFIQGRSHPELRNNPVFKVSFPVGGRIIVHVNSVSRAGAALVIAINNSIVKQVNLPDRDGKYEAFAKEYDIDVVADVPPGTHEVRIENLGTDWYTIDYIIFEKAALKTAKARVYGLTNGTLALAWVKNPERTWWSAVMNETVEPIRNLKLRFKDFKDGLYIVEFYDTRRGSFVSASKVKSVEGAIVIELDELFDDVAVRIRKLEE